MKMSPLGSAMAAQRNDIARTLIDHGADVNAKADKRSDATSHRRSARQSGISKVVVRTRRRSSTRLKTEDPIAYEQSCNHPEIREILSNQPIARNRHRILPVMTAATLPVVLRRLRHDQRHFNRIAQPNQSIRKLRGSIKRLDLVPQVPQLANRARQTIGTAHQARRSAT